MRRLKRSTVQTIIVALICTVVVTGAFGAAYFLYIKQIKESYNAKLEMANKEIQDNKKSAYVAKEKIAAGDEITKEKVDYKEVFTSVPEDGLISDEDFGKLSTINISPQIPVTKDMVTENIMDKDLREEEFNVFYLSSNLMEGDFVDVRIVYPNGEDFIVLSKKAVKDLSLDNSNCFMWLNEEEILTISGAMVDAFLHDGSKLYTTKYIEPLVQEPSQVTYSPSEEVINLIRRDPNVVQRAAENLNAQIRHELEGRLNSFYQNYDGQVSWEKPNNPENASNNSVNNQSTEQTTKSKETGSDDSNENTTTEESEEEIYYVD